MTDGITIQVDQASLNKLLGDFKKYPVEKKKKIQDEIFATLIRIRELAVRKLRSSLKRSKGRIESSVRYLHRGLRGEVFSNYKVSEYIEFGTVAHIIRPVRKKMLAWGRTLGWKGDSPIKEFLAKQVHHPGTKAKPFMRPAARQGTRELMARLKRIL